MNDPRRNHPRKFTVISVNNKKKLDHFDVILSFWRSRDKDRRDRDKEKTNSSASSKEKDVKQEKSSDIKTEVKQDEN